MIEYSALRNQFVRGVYLKINGKDFFLPDEKAADRADREAARFARSHADRLRKLGNKEGQLYASACADLIERCAAREKLLCAIPLPKPKGRRGRKPNLDRLVRELESPRKRGRPVTRSQENLRGIVAVIDLGRRLGEKQNPGARISDAAALRYLLRSKGKTIGRQEKRDIRKLTKIRSDIRRNVRKLVP